MNLFRVFWFELPKMIASYKEEMRDNPFSLLGEQFFKNIEPDWGAAVLLIGTALSLGVAIKTGIKRGLRSWPVQIGIAVALVYGIYLVLPIFFPYLKYWPSLFA